MCDEMCDDYTKEEQAAIALKADIVVTMFDFINKHCGKDNPNNLYPRVGYILVDVLTECLEEAQRQVTKYRPLTALQRDDICYQIGVWYLMMKPLLEGQHNLGYMKEKLKTMICGE